MKAEHYLLELSAFGSHRRESMDLPIFAPACHRPHAKLGKKLYGRWEHPAAGATPSAMPAAWKPVPSKGSGKLLAPSDPLRRWLGSARRTARLHRLHIADGSAPYSRQLGLHITAQISSRYLVRDHYGKWASTECHPATGLRQDAIIKCDTTARMPSEKI